MPVADDRDEHIFNFVQGTLPEAERTALEAEISADPHLAADVATIRGVQNALRNNDDKQHSGADQWQRISDQIDAERNGPSANDNRPSRPFALMRAAAFAAGVVLVWEVALAPVIEGDQQARYVPVSESPAANHASVAFVPDAPIADITSLIRSLNGTIVDGPSAIGLYDVQFKSSGARDAAVIALSDNPNLVLAASAR